MLTMLEMKIYFEPNTLLILKFDALNAVLMLMELNLTPQYHLLLVDCFSKMQ